MFNRDVISLVKQDGTRTDGIRATVAGSDFIKVDGNQYVIEPNDVLLRKLSTGVEEAYRVIDPTFYDESHFGPHYQLKVKKLGLPETRAAIQQITYNLSGVNARVNVNSTDNSTNVINVQGEVTRQLAVIREKVLQTELSDQQKSEALEVVQGADELVSTGIPKRSVMKALLGALPPALEIAASVAAIISALPS